MKQKKKPNKKPTEENSKQKSVPQANRGKTSAAEADSTSLKRDPAVPRVPVPELDEIVDFLDKLPLSSYDNQHDPQLIQLVKQLQLMAVERVPFMCGEKLFVICNKPDCTRYRVCRNNAGVYISPGSRNR